MYFRLRRFKSSLKMLCSVILKYPQNWKFWDRNSYCFWNFIKQLSIVIYFLCVLNWCGYFVMLLFSSVLYTLLATWNEIQKRVIINMANFHHFHSRRRTGSSRNACIIFQLALLIHLSSLPVRVLPVPECQAKTIAIVHVLRSESTYIHRVAGEGGGDVGSTWDILLLWRVQSVSTNTQQRTRIDQVVLLWPFSYSSVFKSCT